MVFLIFSCILPDSLIYFGILLGFSSSSFGLIVYFFGFCWILPNYYRILSDSCQISLDSFTSIQILSNSLGFFYMSPTFLRLFRILSNPIRIWPVPFVSYWILRILPDSLRFSWNLIGISFWFRVFSDSFVFCCILSFFFRPWLNLASFFRFSSGSFVFFRIPPNSLGIWSILLCCLVFSHIFSNSLRIV